MKKFILYIFVLMHFNPIFSQVAGTPFFVPILVEPPLDFISDTPSFAFSTRKLKSTYSGFALRVRKSTDNSEVNVNFDSSNQISNNSSAIYVVPGTSGQAIGTITSLGSYKGAAQLFVTTWYDQSGNSRNAFQSSTANQPELLLATQNNNAVLVFNVSHNIPVTGTAIELLGTTSTGVQGVIGSFFLLTKITGFTNPISFGFSDLNNRRFQSHLNWSDGNCYFDAGGQCCNSPRSFLNSSNVNFWKQYTMQRQDVIKIVRVSGVERLNVTGEIAATPNSTHFGIGAGGNSLSGGHIGQISEAILFNKALNSQQILTLENNQMLFWNSY